MYHKSIFVIFFSAIPYMVPLHADDHKLYLLDFGIIKAVDGKDYGITKNHIGFTWQLLIELQKMQDGAKNTAGVIEGLFFVDGQHYSIKALRQLEAEYEQNHQALPAHFVEALEQTKRHFNNKVLPFLNYAHGLKKIITSLIDESCTLRNRNDSLLRTWGQCEDGKESAMVNTEIKTFKIFDVFITDLIHFLKDFIHSCPKARALFVESVKQKLHHDEQKDHKDPSK
jgi:hypothetical protein